MIHAGNTTPKEGTTHRVVVTNEVTGEVEIEMTNVNGGLLIAHAADDGMIGTHQAGFGTTASIVLCALKMRPVVKQMMKQDPTLAEAIELGTRLAKEAGFETTL